MLNFCFFDALVTQPLPMEIVTPVFPFKYIQVVHVKVKLHAVYCCVKVSDYPSEILPVVLVWIYHSRREECDCRLYV